MQHNDRYVREYAAGLMGQFEEPATETVPALVEMLEDEYPQGRVAAAQSLRKIGAPALDAVPYLIQAYREAETSETDWLPFQYALEQITGKKLFGADRWQKWWNEQ
jgi:HEAT repeat protein